MNLTYPAKFNKEDDGSYWVEFPDLQGCLTQGNNLENVIEMAKEALGGYLDSLKEHKEDFPEPSDIKGEDIHYITAILGKSTSYSEYHKKSYNKNKSKILENKKEKEEQLKKQGFKNFREFLPADTIKKLNQIVKVKHINRRDFLTKVIEE